MACRNIIQGLDLSCTEVKRKYYQQVVLVNKSDVVEVEYDVDGEETQMRFRLDDGKSGFLFRGNENADLFGASFSKSDWKGNPQYRHTVIVPVVGVDLEAKQVLRQLDLSDYFAAIQFRDGTVEVYGFEFGLETSGYTYDVQNGLGGSQITLVSKEDENQIPYIYAGDPEDFDNLFADIVPLLVGDFNDDFSDDFYIET